MPDTKEPEALVVGAGPVGLFTAYSILRGGKSVRIIDSGNPIRKQSYALALHPHSLEMFDRVGLADHLVRHGRKIDRVLFLETGAVRAKAEFSVLKSKFPFVLVLPQNVLEDLLNDELEKLGAKVEWNHAIIRFEQDDRGVRSRIAELGNRPKGPYVTNVSHVEKRYFEIESGFLIGADGYYSTVRRVLEIPMQVLGPARNYVVYELETEEILKDELRVEVHPHGPALLWPMPDGRCRWTFETPMPPLEAPSGLELMSLLQLRAPWFYSIPTKDRWGARVTFAPALADRFGQGRVWLAGDAAHLTLPFGVHSMNAGFAEGAMLAHCILEEGSDRDRERRFTAYEVQRREEWRRLHDLDHATEKITPLDPWLAGNRDILWNALPATGEHLKELMKQVAPQPDGDLVSGMFALPDF